MDQEAMNGQRTQGMEFQATKALHMAARAGHADLCRLLLNHRHSESTDTDGTICMEPLSGHARRGERISTS